MIPWLLVGAVVPSLLVAWVTGWFVRRGAPAWGLVDEPGAQRKVHTRTTPLGGGVAIWLGVVLPLAAGQLYLRLVTKAADSMDGWEWARVLPVPSFVAPHLADPS